MNYVKNPLVYDDTTFGMDSMNGLMTTTQIMGNMNSGMMPHQINNAEEELMTAQINNITFMLPSSPLIYQNMKIPEVRKIRGIFSEISKSDPFLDGVNFFK